MHIQIYEVLQSMFSLLLEANTKTDYKLVISCLKCFKIQSSSWSEIDKSRSQLNNKKTKAINTKRCLLVKVILACKIC